MTTAPAVETDRSTLPGLAAAAVAVAAWGSGSILAKAIDLGGMVIAVYRFGAFFLVMLAWMALRGKPFRASVIRRSAPGGLALAVDVALFFSAVKATSVVNATLIGSMQPVLIGVVAARFFGERVSARDAFWGLVALAGVGGVIISGSDSQVSSTTGDLLAVGALVAWSAYFIFSKRSKETMTSTEFTAGTAFWAGVVNIPIAMAFGQEFTMPTTDDLVMLAAMTLVAGAVGHSLMNWSLAQIPLWVGSTFTLLIPVAAALMAWAFLDEELTVIQVLGTVVVIVALAAIVIGQAAGRRR